MLNPTKRWVIGVSAGVMALTMALAASAQTPPAPPPKAPATPAPKAPKAAPAPKLAACNSIKEEAPCKMREPSCQWVSAAMGKDKAGKEVVKKKAYCRITPAPKKKAVAPAPKAPAAAPSTAPVKK